MPKVRSLLALALALFTLTSVAEAQPLTFVARVDGTQEVPASGVSSIGVVYGYYDGAMMMTVEFQHDVTASMAHVHGPAGVGANGPVRFPFATATTGTNQSFVVLPADVAALVANNFYVNIHSTGFPLGEIRGQLVDRFPQRVYINEYCNDPFLVTPGLDTNLDGVPATAAQQSRDEFVEIVNGTGVMVDISGWTIADSVAIRHVFAAGTFLPPLGAITVFGGGSVTNFNATGQRLGMLSSTGALGLNNASDTIVLADAVATVIDSHTYTSGAQDNGDGVCVTRETDGAGGVFNLHPAAQVLALGGTGYTPPITTHSPGMFLDATFFWPPGSACGDGMVQGPEQCDDGARNGTLASCCTTACRFEAAATPCDDALFCTRTDACNATGTCGGTGAMCDDGVTCTNDTCDELGGSCMNVADDTNCDNGTFCDGAETCDATTDCQTGAAPTCDDSVACTVDSCSAGTDLCVSAPDDSACGDADMCNGTETCNMTLGCQAGTTLDCDDSDVCTTDSCVAASGCMNVADLCLDGGMVDGGVSDGGPDAAVIDDAGAGTDAGGGTDSGTTPSDAGPITDSGPGMDSGADVDAGGGTEDAGCACRAVGARSNGPAGLLGLVLLVGVLVRTRRG